MFKLLNYKMRDVLVKVIYLAMAVGLAASGSLAATSAEPVLSSAGDRSELAITIYNQNLALVREVRRVPLPEGEFALEFRDVPAQIEPRSLVVEAGGRTELVLLEQNYEFDLMSREKILEKYVGQEIAWIQDNGERITGRLLGMAAGPVYEVGGEVLFEVPGRIALPALPQSLRARPTLVWRALTGRGGEAEIEASYLTRGVSWSADYVLQLDSRGQTASLRSWVSVDNRSGAAYEGARLLLVAGEINQVAPFVRGGRDGEVMLAAKMAVDEIQEETLYDYHLYTVPGTTILKDSQIKQIALFSADGVKVQRHYRLEAPGVYYRGGGGQSEKPDVAVFYSFKNEENNRLGRPLPAGTFRVYGESGSGERQLLGEDRIDHTPQKERVELRVGKAFDLAAERVRLDYRRLGPQVHETDFRITLRNHKDEDVSVEVIEQVGGVWRVLASSHPAQKTAAERLVFEIPVPAGGESVLTWTVQVTTP